MSTRTLPGAMAAPAASRMAPGLLQRLLAARVRQAAASASTSPGKVMRA